MFKDYYLILNISTTASKEEIKKAFRKEVQIWHPDKNLNRDTTKEFLNITEAYIILNDDEAREKYNVEYHLYLKNLDRNDGKSPNDMSYFDYIFTDKVLLSWIFNARTQANTIILEIKEDLKGVTHSATQGLKLGIKQMLIWFILINILALILSNC